MTCRKHWRPVTLPHIKWDIKGLLNIKDTNTVASGKRSRDVLPERLPLVGNTDQLCTKIYATL